MTGSWAVGETPEERASRREQVGRLKFLLQKNPQDSRTRRLLVEAYRKGGHPEQAARFAIGLGEPLDPGEERAYIDMLRGLGAHEETARRLSILPPYMELPPRIRVSLAPRRLPGEWRDWGSLLTAVWVCALVLWTVTVGIAYGFTVLGSPDARVVALRWTFATWAAISVALAATTSWALASRKRGPAIVWGMLTAAVGSVTLAAFVRFWG
ncbi:hypothetical protein [Microbacterium sp. LMI1-1-1.1]|uniref:hypothetical protein n=1 Tax=Microbacterium sp. LMI1-1-1.1 TaxID=3135223 RepID=UPI00346741B9